MAARMKGTGVVGKVQASATFVEQLRLRPGGHPKVGVARRGEIDVKGKGKCVTYFLLASNHGAVPEAGVSLRNPAFRNPLSLP